MSTLKPSLKFQEHYGHCHLIRILLQFIKTKPMYCKNQFKFTLKNAEAELPPPFGVILHLLFYGQCFSNDVLEHISICYCCSYSLDQYNQTEHSF